MSRVVLFLSFSLLLPSLLVVRAADPEKVASVEGVTEYRLANGARVLLFPDASKPTLTVNMTVLVGSRHEGYGEAGMAHLLEHMVFKGTPSFGDIPTALRDHGASFNGTTNRDRTNYFETLPANEKNLEFAIHMESDRLVNSFVKHEDLMSEFTVVRNEFERSENSPQGVLARRVMAAAFEWHNYGKTTIGNRSDIERVPIDSLRAFYRKFYQPDNVVMIITGRFDPKKALELSNKYLGSIPTPTRELKPTYTEEPAQDGERQVELRRVGSIGSSMAAYHMPAASHPDWAPLSILASVISEDKVGLLEQALIESKLATSASARADSAHDPGLFMVSTQPTEGNLESAQQVMLETMDQIGTQTFDEQAIERAKRRSARSFENLINDAGRVAQSLSSASSLGDWRLMFLQRDRIQAVTPADVKRVAQTYFPSYNRTVGTFIPTDTPMRMSVPGVVSIAEMVKDYKGGEAVESGEAFDPTPENLDARITTLDMEGIQVGMLKKKNRGETVNMTVNLHFGNEDSLQGLTPAASMLPSLLMSGTKSMDRQALQARMTELGVRISSGGRGGGRRGGRRGGSSGSAGNLGFSIQAKRSSLVPAIQLLGEILREPAFPQKDFEQMKNRSANMMAMMQTEPQMLASSELSAALSDYPKGDVRYTPSMTERIEQIENLSLDQVKQVYQNQLSSVTGEIAIVGDFDTQPVLQAIDQALSGWKTETEYQPIIRDARREMVGEKKEINTPDKANAVFTAGLAFPLNESDADTVALELGNFILGGGTLSSRLGNRIRQKEGLSYGVSSSLSVPAQGTDSRFLIRAITNPENMDAVEKAAMEELNRFIDDGPTEQEVEDSKTAWLERQKVSRSSDSSIAGQIRSNLYLDRTFDYTSQREAQIKALTADQIQAAFRKHVQPEKLIIIRAGDFGSE
ncbi:MAG: insulinase family protein [Mariniblastus sp.]|nr:insulinase family protein [Mariniblastus sp.]